MRESLRARNETLCWYYQAGHSLAECEKKFGLKKQQILKILRKMGAWQPRSKSGRTQFLGINVSDETKVALQRYARRRGLSMSKLTSDALERLVRRVEREMELEK